jgi:Heavy metal associated domain 2
VVAHLPGRLRVRAETFRVLPEVASEVVERVQAEPGVTSASASEISGSLLVLYDPGKTQILRLIRTIVLTGGLAGVEVDRVDRGPGAPPGDRLRGALGHLDARVREVAEGKVDLRTAVPGALAAIGLTKLVGGAFGTAALRQPEWYDLLFWSFVTFSNLNPRPEKAANDVSVAEVDG